MISAAVVPRIIKEFVREINFPPELVQKAKDHQERQEILMPWAELGDRSGIITDL